MAKDKSESVEVLLDTEIVERMKEEASQAGQSLNDYAVSILEKRPKQTEALERINFNMPSVIANRLRAYAKTISRPYGWVICDAVSVYLDSVAAPLAGPDSVDLRKAGKTPAIRRGRPRAASGKSGK